MIEHIECISFKRDCGSNPQSVAAEQRLLSHVDTCDPCSDFYQGMLALDSSLGPAFSLPVSSSSIDQQLSPAFKNANIVSSLNITSIVKRSFNRFKPVIATAASLMLVAFGVFTLQYPGAAIAGEVIEHIHHEPGLLTLTHAVTSDEQIEMVLKQANITLSGDRVNVLSAALCPMAGQLAAHLVVEGESGPVTILILPGKETKTGKIKSKEFNGRILSAEHGTIAVVGGKKENSEHMEKIIRDSFHWQN